MSKLPSMMRAMVLTEAHKPLELMEIPLPEPGNGQVLVHVTACGVCRTDLHILDGDLSQPKLPLVPGHEIVGRVVKLGPGATAFKVGDRVGIPWLGHTCGACSFCASQRENLCDHPQFTGYTVDGGYAEYTAADERFCFPIPEQYRDANAAPLLCAGLIGYRSYRMAGEQAHNLGLYGFGASAHIIAQVAAFEGKKIFAFTSPGDVEKQAFARSLGAAWAGGSDQLPPEPLHAAIIFAPVGSLVPVALKALVKGGVVVCAGIHMSDIPAFPYHILWEERSIRSVANLTRRDGIELLRAAAKFPIHTEVQVFPLEQANQALESLRRGAVQGAAVLKID